MAADWQPLIDHYLVPYKAGVHISDVDLAEEWAANASLYTSPGSWRAKISNGSLWVRPIHMSMAWMERASVLRILLLALREADGAGEPVSDLEIVYAAGDQDPTVLHGGCRRTSRRAPCLKMPVLVHAREDRSSALPIPEFTWVGAKNSLPWCQLSAKLDNASRMPWDSRDSRAFFTGSCSTGQSRQSLLMLSWNHSELYVRDVGFGSSGSVPRQDQRRAERAAHRLQRAPTLSTSVSPEFACSFRYLISLPGFGYASRLRQLLACSSAVIHVGHASQEVHAAATCPSSRDV